MTEGLVALVLLLVVMPLATPILAALSMIAVCLVLMVGGHIGAITLAHLAIATKTGLLAVTPARSTTAMARSSFIVHSAPASSPRR